VHPLRFLVALLAVVAIHTLGSHLMEPFPRAFNVFLVLIILNAIPGHSMKGLSGGLAAGLVKDALSGGPYGLYGFADIIIGYATARAAQRVEVSGAFVVAVVATAASVLEEFVLASLTALLFPGSGAPAIQWTLLRIVTTAILAGSLFALRRHGRQAWERRRRRERPLRFG
jgi:rod shape-determining protein MreD